MSILLAKNRMGCVHEVRTMRGRRCRTRARVPWLSSRGAEAADLAPPDDSELRVGVKSTTSTGTFTMHILSLSLQEDVNVYMYIYI